tara:strand:+ start:398 stop:799 length:402 start_codon:yes stop_codon:yes gene_type:complete
MKEIICGLWIGTSNDLFLKETKTMIHIDCNFNESYLSNDLQTQQFIEKQTSLVSLLYSNLNKFQKVIVFNSNKNNTLLETHQLIIIAYFIKYTDIKINNLINLFQKKLQQPILKNCDSNIYQKIIQQLIQQYR